MSLVRVVGSGVAGLGLVGAGYLGLAGQDETTRNDQGEIVEEGELGAFRIRVGDCMMGGTSGEFASVEGVPCAGPHLDEVYHAFLLADGIFPGELDVQRNAEAGCLAAFSGFVGVSYDVSSYAVGTIYPTRQSWLEFDDREVLCTVGNLDGSLKTGSAQGTAR